MCELANTKILKINDYKLLKDLKLSFRERKTEADLSKLKEMNILKLKGKHPSVVRKPSPGKKPGSTKLQKVPDIAKSDTFPPEAAPRTNPQIPLEYLPDILNNLKQEETFFNTSQPLLSLQKEITDRMRATIVDWIIDIHNKFKLRNETLFLAVNILDNYLTVKCIKRTRLQLLGVASLFIACKYEEIFCPEIRDFVFIMDNTFDNKDITKMEVDILKVLKFNLTMPSTLRFFEILAIKFNLSEKDFNHGKYLLELYLLDSRYRNHLPSHISTCVIYMLMRLSSPEKACSVLNLFKSEEGLINCCMDICFLLENIKTSPYNALNKKYKGVENLLGSNIRLC
jgi:hypothetical protein